jgi:hypothetical protein
LWRGKIMWGKKKQVEEPVEEVWVPTFDDLHAELDDIVETAEQPEADVPEDFEARVAELTVLLREAQERAAAAKLAKAGEGLSPFKTPFESKPASVVDRPRSLNRRITRVEVEAGESRIVSQFEDNEPEEKKVYPAVWNLGYRLEELAAAVAGILVDPDTGEIAHEHEEYAAADHTHDPQDLTHDHDAEYAPIHEHPYASDTHDHDADYSPSTHDHADIKAKDAEQDGRLDALEAEAGSGYDNLYAPGDPLVKGEYSAGDKTATFHPTDSEDEGFAGVDDPWLVVCDDGPIMRIKGATADPPAVDGSITVTWTSDHQLSGTVKLGVVDPIPEHEHEGHDHPYVKSNANTDIRPTVDDLFVKLKTRRPKNEDGTFTDKSFGLAIDLDEGSTYKNQFEVGTSRNGYALRVLGGTGREVWIGGSLAQKDGNKDNPDPEDYVTRKNLTDATDDLATKIELEELQVEVDALATTRDAGRWKVVASAAVRPGEVYFQTTSMSMADNSMTVSDTDLDGKVHGWADLEVGDFVEVVQETAGVRNVGSYGLFKITADNGGTGMRMLELTLDQGQGDLTGDSNVFIKVFHANNDLDLAELDNRYSKKGHTHSGYSSTGHTHSGYASSNHTHSDLGGFVSLSHGPKTWYATNPNWNNNVYFFPFYRTGSGGTSYGGRVDNLGMIDFRKDTGFYRKVGKTGTLIGSTSNSPHFPVVVFQVWETNDYSSLSTGGTDVQRFYGSVIWARNSQSWEDYDPGIYWYFRGAAR